MRKNSPKAVVNAKPLKPGQKKASPARSPRKDPKDLTPNGSELMKSLGKFPKIRQELLTVVSFV